MNPETNPNPREQMEVRLVALLLGEASPFEEAELVKAMLEEPSLAAYYKEMRATIHLAKEASKQAPAGAEHPAQPIAQPKLSAERRAKLLAKFKEPRQAGETEAPPVQKPAALVEAKKGEIIPLPKRERKPLWDSMVFRLAALFIVLGLLASLLMPSLANAKRKAQRFSTAQAVVNNLQNIEGAKEEWALDGRATGAGDKNHPGHLSSLGGRAAGGESDEKAQNATVALGRTMTYAAGTTVNVPVTATPAPASTTPPPPPATVYLPQVEGQVQANLGAEVAFGRFDSFGNGTLKGANAWDVNGPDGEREQTVALKHGPDGGPADGTVAHFSADGKSLAGGASLSGWAEGSKPGDETARRSGAAGGDSTASKYRLNYGLATDGERLAKAEEATSALWWGKANGEKGDAWFNALPPGEKGLAKAEPAKPAPKGLSSVIGVAAGANHSLALRADGAVAAWGTQDSAQPAPTGETRARGFTTFGDFDRDGAVDLFNPSDAGVQPGGQGRGEAVAGLPVKESGGRGRYGGMGGGGGGGGYGGGMGVDGGAYGNAAPGGQPQSQLGYKWSYGAGKPGQAGQGLDAGGLAVADNRAKHRALGFFDDNADFGANKVANAATDPARPTTDDYVLATPAVIDPATGLSVHGKPAAPALGDVPLAGGLFGARGDQAGKDVLHERLDVRDSNGREVATAGRYYRGTTVAGQTPALNFAAPVAGPGNQSVGGAGAPVPVIAGGNGILSGSGPAAPIAPAIQPPGDKTFDAPVNYSVTVQNESKLVVANPKPATPAAPSEPADLAPLPVKMPAPTLKGTPEDISGLVEKRNAEIAAIRIAAEKATAQVSREGKGAKARMETERLKSELETRQLSEEELAVVATANASPTDYQRLLSRTDAEKKMVDAKAQSSKTAEEMSLTEYSKRPARPAISGPAGPDGLDREKVKAGELVTATTTGGTMGGLDKIESMRREVEVVQLEVRDEMRFADADKQVVKGMKDQQRQVEAPAPELAQQLASKLETASSARTPVTKKLAELEDKESGEITELRKKLEEKKAGAAYVTMGTNAVVAMNIPVAQQTETVKLDIVKDSLPAEEKLVEQAQKAPPAPPLIHQPDNSTRENAFSTFSLNVSDVAFKTAAASLNAGALPDPNSVRVEEFINAFNYRDPAPARGAKLAFAWERARYPFAHNRDALRFAVQTAAQGREAAKPLNLVILLDNSGSMERPDRVQIVGESLKVLAQKLQPQDKISVVAFSRTPRLWVDGLAGGKPQELLNVVSGLNPQGGTDLGAGLELAYKTAVKHFLPQGNNRVIMLTDGAANLGSVEPDELKKKVVTHRQKGIALDCFGIGWEGYNDDLLEVLSHNGDGRYSFLNDPEQAGPEFANQLAGALTVAASDVKTQVEFNPERVTMWRQVGYAKHQLKKEQFRDNTVDAAEIAASESGNAIYVIQVNPQGNGPLGVVRVRHKVPATGEYVEQEWTLAYQSTAPALEQAAAPMRLATVAAAFGEWLARSPYAGEVNVNALGNYLNGVPEFFGPDPRPKQLAQMVRQAAALGK